MPSERQPAEQPPIVTDEEIDAAISLCGGDPRLALRAVFVAYTMLAEAHGSTALEGAIWRHERVH
jgi:hypothetical protein